MTHVDSDPETPGDELLAEPPVSGYLGADETTRAVLSNTRVGVARVDEEGTHRVEPAADCGALAVLTDRRVLFAVGQSDGDEVSSVPYVEFAGVRTQTETLTRSLVVETAVGATWEFTVREANDLDAALSRLAADVPEQLLARARDRREEADDAEHRRQRIRSLEGALDDVQRAATVVEAPDLPAADLRAEAESLVADLVEAYLAYARERRSVGNWFSEAGDPDEALDHYDEASDSFERASELAEEYPPGDADAIASERDSLLEKREATEVTASVANAMD